MSEMVHAPLILTLDLDPRSFALFDALRKLHFPPDRNWLSAHLTLFHHLPGDAEEAIRLQLAEVGSTSEPVTLHVSGLRSLGRGVAYAIESDELQRLRAGVAKAWWPRLTAQDRQPFRPHITIQNKVEPGNARSLLEELVSDFRPFTATGIGLQLWRHIGPTWKSIEQFPFGQEAGSD